MTDQGHPAPPGAEPPLVAGVERPRVDDVVYEAFNPEQLQYGMAGDGLPTVNVPPTMPFAPPLSVDTLVCMGDTSLFVMRDPNWGDIAGEFLPERVTRAEGGRYYVTYKEAFDRLSLTAVGRRLLRAGIMTDLDRVAAAVVRWDAARALSRAGGLPRFFLDARIEVEPVRRPCRHFARQMSDLQDNDETKVVERLCSARRDSDGNFLSMRDAQLFACELRDPHDNKSTRRLDRFDEAKIKLGQERIAQNKKFDVDEALDEALKQASGDTGELIGIFGKAGS